MNQSSSRSVAIVRLRMLQEQDSHPWVVALVPAKKHLSGSSVLTTVWQVVDILEKYPDNVISESTEPLRAVELAFKEIGGEDESRSENS